MNDWTDYIETVNQATRILVPGIGVLEGAYEMITTGDPHGAAKFFVPGVGIIENAIALGSDLLPNAPGPIQNASLSVGKLAVLLILGVVVVFVVKD